MRAGLGLERESCHSRSEENEEIDKTTSGKGSTIVGKGLHRLDYKLYKNTGGGKEIGDF